MKPINTPSPNFDRRNRSVDTVVLHYTGMRTAAEAIARLCDPAAKVSAHYLIDEDGAVHQMVPEEMRAWHAGVSSWKGESDINARSIGVELVNPGHEWGYRDFPSDQILALTELMQGLTTRLQISSLRVLGHSDVAPERKEDPGERFPWNRLAAAGLAIGPYVGGASSTISDEAALASLREIGYNVSNEAAAVVAFQRRFLTTALGQGLDPVTKAAIVEIAAVFRGSP